MPDTLVRHPSATSPSDLPARSRSGFASAQAGLIRRGRRPLPPSKPPRGNWRAWAAAVCQAEAEHARKDFWRVVHKLGLAALHDRDDGYGGHERPFLLAHETHACAAASWLSHLQAHENDRHGSWAAAGGWAKWEAQRRRRWLERRRYLWAGFLEQMRRYCAARQETDALRRTA